MMLRTGIALFTLVALGACSGQKSNTARTLGTSQKNDAGADAQEAEEEGPDEEGEDAATGPAEEDASPVETDAGGSGALDATSAEDAGNTSGDADAQSDAGSSVPDAGTQNDASTSVPDAGTQSDASTSVPDAGTQNDAGGNTGGAFSLSVRRGSQPVPNALVLEQNAAGAVVAQHATGSDGVYRSAEAPAGLTAIVLRGAEIEIPTDIDTIVSWYDVAPDDQLVLDLEAPNSEFASVPAYNVSFAAPPAPAIAARVIAGPETCGSGQDNSTPLQGPVTLNWYTRCARGSQNALLGIAYSNTFTPVAFSFNKNVPAIGAAAQAATLGDWSAPGLLDLSVSNLPTTQIASLTFAYGAAGQLFDPYQPGGSLAAGSAQRSGQLPFPVGFADFHSATVQLPLSAEGWLRTIARRQEANLTNMALDWNSALPGATSATFAAGPPALYTYQPAQGTDRADGVAVRLRWTYRSPQVEGPPINIDWILIAPPSRHTLPMPALPAGYPALNSGSNFANFVNSISHLGSTLEDGYRAFLREPARPSQSSGGHVLRRLLEATGEQQGTTFTASGS